VVCELWQIAKDTNQQPQASIHNVIPADEHTSIEHRDGMETHRHHNLGARQRNGVSVKSAFFHVVLRHIMP